MMGNECFSRPPQFRPIRLGVRRHIPQNSQKMSLAVAAEAGLLIGKQLAVRRDEGAMLEIIDAHIRRFDVADGANMPCHLHAELVRLFDSGAQLVGLDVD